MRPTPDKFYIARITERVDLSQDLWKIRLQPEGEFRFVAGQYATLGVLQQDRLIERAYSIVSSPYEPQLEIFIELVPHGELTPLLHRLQVGDTLYMRRVAKGRFLLDRTSGPTNHLLLCTVTGIAPFVSYIRTLVREAEEGKFAGEHRLYVLNGASRSWEFGYREELEGLARQHAWLTYVPTVSRPWEDPQWPGERGRVDDVLRKYADHWGLTPENTLAYLCGHPQMIENGKGILQRRGFQRTALREESFWVPAKPARTAAKTS
jgi:ferredoxin--NADP+ reductase